MVSHQSKHRKAVIKVFVIVIIIVLLFSVIGIVAVYLNSPTTQIPSQPVANPTYNPSGDYWVEQGTQPSPNNNEAENNTVIWDYEIVVDTGDNENEADSWSNDDDAAEWVQEESDTEATDDTAWEEANDTWAEANTWIDNA